MTISSAAESLSYRRMWQSYTLNCLGHLTLFLTQFTLSGKRQCRGFCSFKIHVPHGADRKHWVRWCWHRTERTEAVVWQGRGRLTSSWCVCRECCHVPRQLGAAGKGRPGSTALQAHARGKRPLARPPGARTWPVRGFRGSWISHRKAIVHLSLCTLPPSCLNVFVVFTKYKI